jgi:hypothetical protein
MTPQPVIDLVVSMMALAGVAGGLSAVIMLALTWLASFEN